MLIETLTSEEARVLGTLLEKSLATPDYYPMTLNALRTACNQKSSREPVTDYDDETVSAALAGLKRKTLVTFTPYGSQPGQYKYRHFLEDVRFNLRKPALAALAVLLLRGAQTLNDIRIRASGLHPLDSLAAAEAALRDLADRPEPLAELLPKRPGWKEPRWRDLLREHGEEAAPGIAAPEASLPAAPASEAPAAIASGIPVSRADSPGTAPAPAARAPQADPMAGEALRAEIAGLRREVSEMRETLAALKADVERMRADLY